MSNHSESIDEQTSTNKTIVVGSHRIRLLFVGQLFNIAPVAFHAEKTPVDIDRSSGHSFDISNSFLHIVLVLLVLLVVVVVVVVVLGVLTPVFFLVLVFSCLRTMNDTIERVNCVLPSNASTVDRTDVRRRRRRRSIERQRSSLG
jgi:Ca2+/Na+ antiporter